MKKIYLLALSLIAAIAVSAQCTPDPNVNQPGYYPEELDSVDIGVAYEMVLHLRIPNDTDIVFNGTPVTATFDSIRLISVNGMPSGFTYVCNQVNCNFMPMQTYCAKLSGTATAQQEGDYPLELIVVAYAKVGPFPVQQPDTIRRFTMVVGSGSPQSILAPRQAYGIKVYPNPASKEVTVWAEGNETLTYTLLDITGKTHRTEVLDNANGLQVGVISLEGLAKGIYFVQVQGIKGTATAKLVVE